MSATIIYGSAAEILSAMPDGCVDTVITSPPYFGLRDYGVKGQLGLEATFQEYIQKLADIFDSVRWVLKETGTCWVNLGDTYASSGSSGSRVGGEGKNGLSATKHQGRGRTSWPLGVF